MSARRTGGRAAAIVRSLRVVARGDGAAPDGGEVEASRVDAGSAIVEFLAVTVILLVPIVYLVLVLGRLQAATFALDGAARDAGRAYANAPTVDSGASRALASVGIALADQGFGEVDPATALVVECSSVPCLEPGSDVAARVTIAVPLPFVPAFVQSVVPLAIPVSAEHVEPVDQFRERP